MSKRMIAAAGIAATVFAGAAAANDNTMYIVENSTDTLWAVDVVNLTATQIGALNTNFTFGGLGYNVQRNTMYGYNTGDDSLYTIDLNTGNATLVGTDATPFGLDSFDVNPITGQGVALGVSDEAWDINLDTGAATLITNTDPTGATGIAFDDNGTLFELDRNADVLNTINLGDGSVTQVGALGFDTSGTSMGFNFKDGFLYAFDGFNTPGLIQIDPNTGATTLLGTVVGLPTGNGEQYTAATFVVPAPSGIALLGLAGFAAARRRR